MTEKNQPKKSSMKATSAEIKATASKVGKAVEQKTSEVKKAAEVKTAEVVKAAEKKTAEVKKTVAEKKATVRTKKEVKTTLIVEHLGRQIEEKDMVAAVKKVWTKSGNKVGEIKTMDLYMKPEDMAVYFVINGSETGKAEL